MLPSSKEQAKKLGGKRRPVEVDETYWGNHGKLPPGARGWGHKMKILSVVDREGGKRSFHLPDAKAKTVLPILEANVDKRSRIMTDESSIYARVGLNFFSHESVNHKAKEYARGDVTTNTVEGSFSILKRSFYGTFHQVSERHLHRYLAELDFKWNTRKMSDGKRIDKALKGIERRAPTRWELTRGGKAARQ